MKLRNTDTTAEIPTADFFAEWALENGDAWFPFARMEDQILFVNPRNPNESYWTKDENYGEY